MADKDPELEKLKQQYLARCDKAKLLGAIKSSVDSKSLPRPADMKESK